MKRGGKNNLVSIELRRERLEKHERKKDSAIEVASQSDGDAAALTKMDFSDKVINALVPYGPGNANFMRTRLTYSGTTTQTTVQDTLGAYAFDMSSVPGFSDLATVFDQYKIEAVSISFSPQTVFTDSTSTYNAPRLYTVIDYDDASAPTSLSVLRQYGTAVVTAPNKGVTRTLCPRQALLAYQGIATSGYVNSEASWVDVAYSQVQHYGVKYGIEQAAASQTTLQLYRVDIVLYTAFRAAR